MLALAALAFLGLSSEIQQNYCADRVIQIGEFVPHKPLAPKLSSLVHDANGSTDFDSVVYPFLEDPYEQAYFYPFFQYVFRDFEGYERVKMDGSAANRVPTWLSQYQEYRSKAPKFFDREVAERPLFFLEFGQRPQNWMNWWSYYRYLRSQEMVERLEQSYLARARSGGPAIVFDSSILMTDLRLTPSDVPMRRSWFGSLDRRLRHRYGDYANLVAPQVAAEVGHLFGRIRLHVNMFDPGLTTTTSTHNPSSLEAMRLAASRWGLSLEKMLQRGLKPDDDIISQVLHFQRPVELLVTTDMALLNRLSDARALDPARFRFSLGDATYPAVELRIDSTLDYNQRYRIKILGIDKPQLISPFHFDVGNKQSQREPALAESAP